MDDIGPVPTDAIDIELWIGQQLKASQSPEYIADELLKKWERFPVPLESKNTISRYCLMNRFIPSLIRILKTDLHLGVPMPWSFVLEIFSVKNKFPLTKELADALLAGATRDHNLHSLSATAQLLGEPDSRWKKIFDSEVLEKISYVKEEREKLLKDLHVFKAERMDAELAQALTRILTLFPDDQEAQSLFERIREQELEKKIDQLKDQYRPEEKARPKDEESQWPELDLQLDKIKGSLTREEGYLLSISLFQMNFFTKALEVLRTVKPKWSLKEELWEIELLIVLEFYAEALNSSQIILSRPLTDVAAFRAALYYSAKSYYGLGDLEQATSILQGIIQLEPNYRDASILLLEWAQ